MKGKKVFKNIFSSFFMQLITIVCGFIIPVTLIKEYGSDVNGLITSITQFLSYITLLESGVGAVVKSVLYKPIAQNDTEKIKKILKSSEGFFRTISYIYIFYIVGLCFVFPIMMNGKFDTIFTISLVLIISISNLLEYYFGITYSLFLNAKQEGYIVSSIRIITMVINVIVLLILVKLNASIQLVKLSTALIFVLRPLLQSIYVKKKYKIDLRNVSNDYKLEQKWDGVAQHIANVVHNNTDVAVLTIFSDIKEVSVYSVYNLVTSSIKQFITSLVSGIDSFLGDIIAREDKKTLNKYFSMYESVFLSLITIIFSCALILILPFIKIYTSGISDISYVRPSFAFIIVLSEFVCMIRIPYIGITHAAGHFKETRIGAWVEAFSNIILSIILVIKFGIVGVAIGTLFAMTIRTIEFIYHSNKYILNRNIFETIKKIILLIIETSIILIIFNFVLTIKINSYLDWFIYGILIFSFSFIVTFGINFMFYKEQYKNVIALTKKVLNKGIKEVKV